MWRSFMIALMFACAVINLILLVLNIVHGNPFLFVNAIGLVACIVSLCFWLTYDG